MAALLLLLAIVGGITVGDLVLENTGAGEVTVFNRTVTGYTQGSLLAMSAALGFVVGLLVVASMSSTRGRRARRRELRAVEQDLGAEVAELRQENASLRTELAARDRTARLAQPDRTDAPESPGRHMRSDPALRFRPTDRRAP